MPTSATFVARLQRALGDDAVLTDPSELAAYGSDRCRGDWPIAPTVVARPIDELGVTSVVRVCAEEGVAIVPSGGRTGLAGGAAAPNGECVLSLERMRRILAVDAAGRLLRAQAGATVEDVQLAASAHGLLYPVDFAAKGSAQIGGSIATNAGGVRVLRYGSTRAWVSGLRVVLANGEAVELGGSLVKDNTGYDLRQLFIGSEGTLGVIVEATLRLTQPPPGLVTVLCAVASEPAILELFARMQRALVLQAFEFFDHACLEHVLAHRDRSGGPFAEPAQYYVLVEVESESQSTDAMRARVMETLEAATAAGEITDAVISASSVQARELWSLREDISESLHRHRPHKNDIALPVARVAEFMSQWRPLVRRLLPGAQALVFGHIGDGNLHLNVLPPPDMEPAAFVARCRTYDAEAYALVHDFSGSISAEHGIGLLKREHLHFSRDAAQIAAMRAIKLAFDPHGLFNPGKLFQAGA